MSILFISLHIKNKVSQIKQIFVNKDYQASKFGHKFITFSQEFTQKSTIRIIL